VELDEQPNIIMKEKFIMYKPNPIDTSKVSLDKNLLELTEKIAENVHDIWALGRMNEGWTYGPKRDDVNKHHPCLVPYEELSDGEKEYDRNTALETLKMISALGYKIIAPNIKK
jgi:ryanodine receptor 2